MRLELVVARKGLVTAMALSIGVMVIFGAVADVILMTYPGPTLQETLHRLSLMRDDSIPTWVSSFLLLGCGVLLAVSARAAAESSPLYVKSWLLLALVFLCLSIDEVAMVHELTGIILRKVDPSVRQLGSVFRYSWVLVAVPVLAVLGAVLLRWFLSLDPRTKIQFTLAGILYLGGAVGMEMINAGLESAADGHNGPLYALSTALEETLECVGLLTFIHALMDRLSRISAVVVCSFAPARTKVEDRAIPMSTMLGQEADGQGSLQPERSRCCGHSPLV
ncbi:hypothetical protein [Sphingomonas sp. S2-65]|uniref:hypothetical protein n=1 Tax=Sphingomonas sp. S2-65 TaxID=2903960 RepID=UPI001F2C7A62|nr:hypothetical protein [Sphingomonas sp. S2-65]UYY57036.1 hypothetical protein LZ586_10090 [Sphingomonas sp. S2-65]